MFISMNWIRDYVDLSGLDLNKLIHQFSLSTAEVENEIFYKGSDLKGVVVAEIKSVEEHPNSKKLHLLKVDIGEEAPVDVVCGAPNVRVGMKTAFARVGAQLGYGKRFCFRTIHRSGEKILRQEVPKFKSARRI